MQQQQRLGTHERAATTVAGDSLLSCEDTFEAARHAAMTMFKQRTRDLTRLSSLQEQQQALEGEQQQLEGVVAELQAALAQTEATAEQEEQRVRERTALLQQLRDAMNSLAEVQRLSTDVSRATDRAVTAAKGFVSNGAGSGPAGEGDAVRLLRLLEDAQQRINGRGAGDFRAIAADQRRRDAALRELMAEARRTAAIPRALPQAVREWVEGSWRQHEELRLVREESSALLAVTRGVMIGSNATSAAASRTASPATSPASASLRAAAEDASDAALDAGTLFTCLSPEQNEARNTGGSGAMQDSDTQAAHLNAVRERVTKVVNLYIAELHSLSEEETAATARCEAHGVAREVLEAGALRSLTADWRALLVELEEALASVAESDATARDVVAAATNSAAATASRDAQAEAMRREALATEELLSRQQVLEEGWAHYGVALANARGTLEVQAATMEKLICEIEKMAPEIAEKEAAVVACEREMVAEASGQAAAAEALAAEVTRAQEEATVAARAASEKEERCRAMEAATKVLSERLDALLYALSSDDANVTEDVLARALAEAAEIEHTLLAAGEQGVSVDSAAQEQQTALNEFLLTWDDASIDALRDFAVSRHMHDLASLVNGSSSSSEEVAIRALASARDALLRERDMVREHRLAMEAAKRETSLLEAELA